MSSAGGGGDREAAEQLAREYRQVGRELADVREKDDTGVDELLVIAEKVEELWPRVQRPQEAVIDSKVVLSLAKMVGVKVQEIEVNAVEFRPADFALRLKGRFGCGTAKQLMEMGRRLKHYFARSPALTYLHGALGDGPAEVVLPKRQRARQVDRVGDLQATKEERLHKFKGNSEETDAKVEELFRTLIASCKKAKGAVPYFQFILHPNDFGVSIENAFHASFLVHDGRVQIYIDEMSGLPAIGQSDQEGAAQGQGAERRAVVINFTMEDWRRLRPRPDRAPEPAPRSEPGRPAARAGLEQVSGSGLREVEVPGFGRDDEEDDTVENALDQENSDEGNEGDSSDEDSDSSNGSSNSDDRVMWSDHYHPLHAPDEAVERVDDGRTVEAVIMVDYSAGYPRRKFPLSKEEMAAMKADRHPSYPAINRGPEDSDSEDDD